MKATTETTKKRTKKVNTDWFEITKRAWLPINKNTVDTKFVPKEVPFESSDKKKLLEQVGIAVGQGKPVLLIGETGTGKTSLVRHLAYKTNNAFVRVNHNGGTTIEDLAGRWLIDGSGQTVWVDGLLVEAMKNGYWFDADEINVAGADINFIYHSLLDDDGRVILAEKGNEVVIPHKNFRFFATMNPPSEYAGGKEMNKALVDRFVVCKVDFAAPDVERDILVARTGIPADVAENMVRCAGEVRIMHQKEEVHFVFSTRTLLQWADMFKVYKRYILAAETTVLNKIGGDDFEAIRDLMGLNFKALDEKTKKATAGGSADAETVEPEDATSF